MTTTPASPRNSGLAITSLVLGVLGFLTLALTSLPAIICGHVARSRIRRSEGAITGSGIALTGLIGGYASIVVTAIAVGLLIKMLAPPSDQSGEVSQDTVDRFADRAGLVIPPSAKATEYRWIFSQDGQEFLKLEMPAADLATFLRKSGLDGVLVNTDNPNRFDSLFGDFLPAPPTKFREGQKSLPDDEWLNVIVDEDSATTAVIYLSWFGT